MKPPTRSERARKAYAIGEQGTSMSKKVARPKPDESTTSGGGSSQGTKRVLATDEGAGSPGETHMRRPDERDESADAQATRPRAVMKQAHADLQSGQQDTDARNRVAEVLPSEPKTPQNFERSDQVDQEPLVEKKPSRVVR